MRPLFAHHDMLDSLDFLGLAPTTVLDHAVAFLIYGALLAAVVLLPLGLRRLRANLARGREAVGERS